MRRSLRTAWRASLAAWVLVSARADATPPGATATGTAQPERPASRDEREGLDAKLAVSTTLNVNDNRDVVGQTSGASVTLGYKLDGQATWVSHGHEWRSTLSLAEGLARTARLPVVVKSQDLLRVESVYLRRVLPWLGPYVRAAGDGPLLSGFDERPAPVDYVIARRDGRSDTVRTNHLQLTSMARPFSFKESLGVFARVLREETRNLEVRTGVGGRQTLADGQLALLDRAGTPEIEVVELDAFHQLGPELTAAAWGRLLEGTVTYRANLDAMLPVTHSFYSVDTDASPLDLLNLEATANVTVKVASWASLDYQLRIVRQPQLFDATQVQNNLLLTFGIAREFGPRLEPPESPLDRAAAPTPTPVVPQSP